MNNEVVYHVIFFIVLNVEKYLSNGRPERTTVKHGDKGILQDDIISVISSCSTRVVALGIWYI
jgi:hypothetical protein